MTYLERRGTNKRPKCSEELDVPLVFRAEFDALYRLILFLGLELPSNI